MEHQYEYFRAGDAGLPANVWSRFGDAAPSMSCPGGKMIYFQGEPAEYFYYIVEGTVKTFISSGGGEEQTLTVYRAEDIFGEASFFDGLPRVSSARAVSRCRIVPVSRETVSDCFARDPALALSMLKYLARTVRMLSSHVDNLSFLRADRRIARHLLRLREEGDAIACTHEEIGSSVGASRVTVSRVLGEFARRGWISTGYRAVTIRNSRALTEFALSEEE